jgi:hypothetical protein
MKSLFTSILLTLSATTFAQIPSYVPSNGLVGWWPFNGNANDESGNGNNGTVNGATLTTDRFGNVNCAYNFNSNPDVITCNSTSFQNQEFTISGWFKLQSGFSYTTVNIAKFGPNDNSSPGGYSLRLDQNDGVCGVGNYQTYGYISDNSNFVFLNQVSPYTNFTTAQNWNHYVITKSADTLKIFLNNNILNSAYAQSMNISFVNAILQFGNQQNLNNNPAGSRQLDDIGIWNRALTEAEIATLFEGCNLSVTTQPQDQNVTTSLGTASFSTATSSQTSSYQWQSNLGLGFQNLSNAGQYSGAASSILTVSNLSMSNNNQVFRCIINDGGCADTTSEAILTITDDASLQSNTPSTFKLYPNPVKDELFIKGMTEAVLPFEVYSTDGKKVLSGTTSGAIDVNALKKGSYQLKMREQTIPFVKQ